MQRSAAQHSSGQSSAPQPGAVKSSEAKQAGSTHIQNCNTLTTPPPSPFHTHKKQVPVFGGLTNDQLVLMRDHMSDAPFHKNDYLIEQGAPGREFFVLIEGKCEAVREEEDDDGGIEETLLKEYGQFEVFGERALLKSEPRFCAIRALTDCKTVTLTQDDFERIMGKPLSKLLPDYF